MPQRAGLFVVAICGVVGVGCPGKTGATCVPGASVNCGCPGGAIGTQLCQAGGTYGSCACPGGTSGATGAGSSGSTGTSAAEGTGSSSGGGVSSSSGGASGGASGAGLGTPCAKNADCASGYCTQVGGPIDGGWTGYVCSEACSTTANCIPGWTCAPIPGIASSNYCTCSYAPESCNGKDDDCNGIVDDQPAANLSCGAGLCVDAGCVCPDGGCSPTCTLTTSPAQLSFGNVAPGSTATLSVTLSNVGGAVCHVANVALSPGSDSAYALGPAQATSLQVQPGSSAQVAVTFSPPTGAGPPLLRRGTLTFTSDDPSSGSGSVPLTAYISQQAQYQSGWPKWHMDSFNTGRTSADTSWLQGSVVWKFSIGAPSGHPDAGTYINSPVIDGHGSVYQMNMSGKFYALSNAGTALWTVQLNSPAGDPHPSTAALLKDGSMFVASGSDGTPPNLYYISDAGAILFSEPFGEDGFDSCPTVGADGTLFMADDDGPASSGGSGDPYSAVAFQVSGSSVPQIAGLALPISTESERFGVVVASDGSTYWGNNGQFFGVTSPSAGFKQMTTWPAAGVTTSNAGKTDPNILSAVLSDIALDSQTNDNLYAYSAWEDVTGTGGYTVQGNLAALDPGTGAQRWMVTLPAVALPAGSSAVASDSGNAAPAIAADGTVYVGNGDGLRAIDGATGTVKWTFTSADVTSSPAIGGDGTVFFGVADGSFYAVHPDGTLRFKVSTGGRISSSPAIALDGTVVFVSDDGYVYALH